MENDTISVEDYNEKRVGPEQEAQLPEKWELLSSLPTYPQSGTFIVEVLKGGIKAGRSWEIVGSHPYDLVARIEAYNICKVTRCLVRIALKGYVDPVCAFWTRGTQMYIAFPVQVVENQKKVYKWVEHEILDAFDERGGEIRVAEEDPDHAE